ncbi:hypothetical protein B0919_14800 [Hymenobacter sp. CRA2]|nr:hypothetical protein B0919_14800 [Hymenobacter sp. CRA2]
MQLFARPHDPLPQEITELTGLDMAETRLITAIHSNQALARQLLEAPEMLYAFLVVGRLVLTSPLANTVLDYLQQQTSMGEAEVASLRQHTLSFGAAVAELIGSYLAGGDAEVGEELDGLRRQVENAFQQLAGTATAVAVPAGAEVVMETALTAVQLRMMQLAVTMLLRLPGLSEHAFAQALPSLRACPLPDVAALQRRLRETQPDEYLTFSLAEVALLYQASQVLGMVLTSHLFDELLMASSVPGVAETFNDESTPYVQLICGLIEDFVEFVQDNFDDEPLIEAARTETAALADLLV